MKLEFKKESLTSLDRNEMSKLNGGSGDLSSKTHKDEDGTTSCQTDDVTVKGTGPKHDSIFAPVVVDQGPIVLKR